MAPTLVAFTTQEKTAHNSHKFGFTLSPTNYGFWKTMLEPFLITNSLFDYVNGTIPCPSPYITITTTSKEDTSAAATTQTPNPDYNVWITNDAHVRMLIISTISESSFQHVQGSTSRDVWLSLERAYAPHTSSCEFTLKTQLLKIEMKSDESSSAYLNRAQEYSDALANIGEPMKENDVIMLVVSGLREDYNNFKSSVLRHPPQQFSELHGLLADHDYMQRKTQPEVTPAQAFTAAATTNRGNTTSPSSNQITALQQLLSQFGLKVQPQTTSSTTAFYASRGSNNNFRGGRGNRGRGRGNYNRSQHTGGGNRSQFPWASNQNIVFGTCHRCGIGHIPSECPYRDPSSYRRPPTSPSTHYADYRSQSSTSSWLPDRGCNHHVASDHSGFEHSEPYYGDDHLHVGNGQVHTQYPPHWSKP